jgi:hypothetical protein
LKGGQQTTGTGRKRKEKKKHTHTRQNFMSAIINTLEARRLVVTRITDFSGITSWSYMFMETWTEAGQI